MLGDQLVATGKSWKSYHQSLPTTGADGVNYSDGFYTTDTNFEKMHPGMKPELSQGDVQFLYAVKHNPFAYFRSVQEGKNPQNSLKNMVGFDGMNGLFADLQSGTVPHFSLIVPNQCNDHHGLNNAGPMCATPQTGQLGTLENVNPALMYRGDVTVNSIVTAIQQSKIWKNGRNAIILVWDEDHYTMAPDTNRVACIIDTSYGKHGIQSAQFYTHYSLLKTLEAGFGLPCLNHACDKNAVVMSDLFS